MIDLKEIMRQYPNCMSSRAAFKSVLMDKYPSEKRTVNILTILFECGIANKIKAKRFIDANEMQGLLAQVEKEYGISGQYAQDAILIWAAAFDVTASAVKVRGTEAATPAPSRPAEKKPIVYVQGDVEDYEVVQKEDGYYIARLKGFEEEEMTIPSMIDGKKIIGIAEKAFHGCVLVRTIHISEGIEVIGDSAFGGCKSLEKVALPDTLRRIGSSAFASTSLTVVAISQNVEFLGPGSFSWCSNLKRIELSNKIATIRKETFEGCSELSEIQLPDNLVTIEENAFERCSSLCEVHIPVGTQKIGNHAFYMTHLTDVYVPPTVTTIGDASKRSSLDLVCDSVFGFRSLLTIYCATGSAAMEYARKHGIRCAKAQF